MHNKQRQHLLVQQHLMMVLWRKMQSPKKT
jgi:hypothetical protein